MRPLWPSYLQRCYFMLEVRSRFVVEVYIGSDINGRPDMADKISNKPEHDPIPERRKPDDTNPTRHEVSN